VSETLDVTTKPVNIVSWLTYSYQREKGILGLSKFLAVKYSTKHERGIQKFDLLEVKNDTEYLYEIELKVMDAAKLAEILERGNLEEWYLRALMCDACAKGFIQAGTWIVKVSW